MEGGSGDKAAAAEEEATTTPVFLHCLIPFQKILLQIGCRQVWLLAFQWRQYQFLRSSISSKWKDASFGQHFENDQRPGIFSLIEPCTPLRPISIDGALKVILAVFSGETFVKDLASLEKSKAMISNLTIVPFVLLISSGETFVVEAKVWIHDGQIASLIYVKDCNTGTSIEDYQKINRLEACLRSVLQGDSDVRSATISLSDVVIHPERRLHQMMFADRDYEKNHMFEFTSETPLTWNMLCSMQLSTQGLTKHIWNFTKDIKMAPQLVQNQSVNV
ncbi:ACT domain-containing protein ACR8 [Trifolium repens]|nr:ACT domain-containing protein ACR8 [Trifolium repens]